MRTSKDNVRIKEQNKTGEKIIEFCQKNNLKIIGLNTLFKKKKTINMGISKHEI